MTCLYQDNLHISDFELKAFLNIALYWLCSWLILFQKLQTVRSCTDYSKLCFNKFQMETQNLVLRVSNLLMTSLLMTRKKTFMLKLSKKGDVTARYAGVLESRRFLEVILIIQKHFKERNALKRVQQLLCSAIFLAHYNLLMCVGILWD